MNMRTSKGAEVSQVREALLLQPHRHFVFCLRRRIVPQPHQERRHYYTNCNRSSSSHDCHSPSSSLNSWLLNFSRRGFLSHSRARCICSMATYHDTKIKTAQAKAAVARAKARAPPAGPLLLTVALSLACFLVSDYLHYSEVVGCDDDQDADEASFLKRHC